MILPRKSSSQQNTTQSSSQQNNQRKSSSQQNNQFSLASSPPCNSSPIPYRNSSPIAHRNSSPLLFPIHIPFVFPILSSLMAEAGDQPGLHIDGSSSIAGYISYVQLIKTLRNNKDFMDLFNCLLKYTDTEAEFELYWSRLWTSGVFSLSLATSSCVELLVMARSYGSRRSNKRGPGIRFAVDSGYCKCRLLHPRHLGGSSGDLSGCRRCGGRPELIPGFLQGGRRRGGAHRGAVVNKVTTELETVGLNAPRQYVLPNLTANVYGVASLSQNVIRRGLGWRVGDGVSISVWNDPWLPNNTSPFVLTPLADYLRDARVENLLNVEKSGWDLELLEDLFVHDDVALIKSVSIAEHQQEDKLIWMEEEQGNKSFFKNGQPPMEEMGFGPVLRDANGAFVAARQIPWPGLFKPDEAEALGVKEALKWLKELNEDQVEVESDSLKVTNDIPSGSMITSFDLIVNDIRKLASDFVNLSFLFGKRSADRGVHFLTRVALSKSDRVDLLSPLRWWMAKFASVVDDGVHLLVIRGGRTGFSGAAQQFFYLSRI
nr:uncharacterized protein LOC109177101 [Ipomoea batatas]